MLLNSLNSLKHVVYFVSMGLIILAMFHSIDNDVMLGIFAIIGIIFTGIVLHLEVTNSESRRV